jgi:dolichol-phosphate mannosyltransferase
LKICVSFIIPTLNEVGNIEENVRLIGRLVDLPYEIIFVDDNSSDGTQDKIEALVEQGTIVRLVRRIRERGLASAVMAGVLAARGDYVCVIDGDLQYDLSSIPIFIRNISSDDRADLYVFTRFQGDIIRGTGTTIFRDALTNLFNKLCKLFIPTGVSDPGSGFFAIRRLTLLQHYNRLSILGFKILLDILISVRPLKIFEIPTSFRPRGAGESKVNTAVFIDLIEMMLDKLLGRLFPPFFIFYALSGCVGLICQILIHDIAAAMFIFGGPLYFFAQVCAILVNFSLNNLITFRQSRLRGHRMLVGFLKYGLISSACIFLSLQAIQRFPLVGDEIAFESLLLGATFNFLLSKYLVWRVR